MLTVNLTRLEWVVYSEKPDRAQVARMLHLLEVVSFHVSS
jgi:hypothetical protein